MPILEMCIMKREIRERLIVRDWYQLKSWNLSAQGACVSCGEMCAGIFEETPGIWGARRQSVRLTA
jgi:pyruvate formate lyase activating enzyme